MTILIPKEMKRKEPENPVRVRYGINMDTSEGKVWIPLGEFEVWVCPRCGCRFGSEEDLRYHREHGWCQPGSRYRPASPSGSGAGAALDGF